MEKNRSILTKENSLILRGMAILVIMYHNFLHMEVFGFCQENEMSFVQDKADIFFKCVSTPSPTIVFELISFLGWIGVPVFVFLTGYGLAVNPPRQVGTKNVNICIKVI